MPQVFIKPKGPVDSEKDKYDEYDVDNIKVYFNRELVTEDTVRVRFPEIPSDLSDREFDVEGATPPLT